jgi:hypothetical protein
MAACWFMHPQNKGCVPVQILAGAHGQLETTALLLQFAAKEHLHVAQMKTEQLATQP